MKLYKGDIIQKSVDQRGNKLEWCWGSELIGINESSEFNDCKLWFRPFKNKVKHIIGKILNKP